MGEPSEGRGGEADLQMTPPAPKAEPGGVIIHVRGRLCAHLFPLCVQITEEKIPPSVLCCCVQLTVTCAYVHVSVELLPRLPTGPGCHNPFQSRRASASLRVNFVASEVTSCSSSTGSFLQLKHEVVNLQRSGGSSEEICNRKEDAAPAFRTI